jgi:mono/diheme cytochrome c family protein
MSFMPSRFPMRRFISVLTGTLLVSGAFACAHSVRAGGAEVAAADPPAPTTAGAAAAPLAGGPAAGNSVARGQWLVTVLGCGDCHTPRLPEGRQDPNFLFAGHKSNDPYPAWDDSLYTKGYGMLVSTSGTAFAGPWGVTFARNLTPDKTTGIGGWDDEAFINVLREGTLKPPMPLSYGQLADDDLKAIHAYLASLKPVENLVPFRQLTPPRLPGEIPGKKVRP